jgi:hypothetical protein
VISYNERSKGQEEQNITDEKVMKETSHEEDILREFHLESEQQANNFKRMLATVDKISNE